VNRALEECVQREIEQDGSLRAIIHNGVII